MAAIRMRRTRVGLLVLFGALACRPEAESLRLAGMGVSDSAGAKQIAGHDASVSDTELRRLWAGED
ncbi:MAG TPA: hypothetical protein VMM79_01800, partial [Longimicrobiales bacterium]|nr:hypothetical protein [Longimicrobiales bacterium]